MRVDGDDQPARPSIVSSGDPAERKRNAALLLSTTGAAVAGAGLGALLHEMLRPIALAIVAVGLAAHLVGMVGSRRVQQQAGYGYARWEIAAYWLCWALILILLAVVIFSSVGAAAH